MSRSGGPAIGRREFLRGAATAGVGIALVGVPGIAAAESSARVKLAPVYRLSTHGMSVCNACRGHGANRYYRLRKYANRGRAHVGCNCRILCQRIPQLEWNQFFVRRNGTLRKVWDVRG